MPWLFLHVLEMYNSGCLSRPQHSAHNFPHLQKGYTVLISFKYYLIKILSSYFFHPCCCTWVWFMHIVICFLIITYHEQKYMPLPLFMPVTFSLPSHSGACEMAMPAQSKHCCMRAPACTESTLTYAVQSLSMQCIA